MWQEIIHNWDWISFVAGIIAWAGLDLLIEGWHWRRSRPDPPTCKDYITGDETGEEEELPIISNWQVLRIREFKEDHKN